MEDLIKIIAELVKAYREVKSTLEKPLVDALKDVVSQALYSQLTDLGVAKEFAPADINALKKIVESHFKRKEDY
ncbi:MAG: hypothetical protein QXP98_00220 [Thermoproteus sp.]